MDTEIRAAGRGTRCQRRSTVGATARGGAPATTWPTSTPSKRRRPAASSASTAGTTGSSCGYAYPAAGWPAPTIHLTSTPKPTTKRQTTRSPFRCGPVRPCVGATSTNARSDNAGATCQRWPRRSLTRFSGQGVRGKRVRLLPRGVDVARERFSQLAGIVVAQVDLVLGLCRVRTSQS
jgi:hypothetical protein